MIACRHLPLIGLLVLSPPRATAQEVQFAEMRWGLRSDLVTKQLVARGYMPMGHTRDGDLLFRQRTEGPGHVVTAMLYENRLAKVLVVLGIPPIHAIDGYGAMKEQLTAKYGEPIAAEEKFDSPYDEAASDRNVAATVGKAHLMAIWIKPTLGGEAALTLAVRENGLVVAIYEGPKWRDAAARRRKQVPPDF